MELRRNCDGIARFPRNSLSNLRRICMVILAIPSQLFEPLAKTLNESLKHSRCNSLANLQGICKGLASNIRLIYKDS